MQLMISDHATESIRLAAQDLQQRLLSEADAEYSIENLQKILLRCLDSLVDDWCADAVEHCTRAYPYGWSQTEFDRLLQTLTPTSLTK